MCTFSEESLLNAYVKKCHELETVRTANNRLRTTLDSNYENADSHKTINEHGRHLIVTKKEQILILFKKYESLVGGILGTWDMNPVDFELKEVSKPSLCVCACALC